jgi:hypothetical protein
VQVRHNCQTCAKTSVKLLQSYRIFHISILNCLLVFKNKEELSSSYDQTYTISISIRIYVWSLDACGIVTLNILFSIEL